MHAASPSVTVPAVRSRTATLGLLVLAVVGHLLLLDAAIEILWSALAIRWAAAGAVFAVAAVSLLAWRPGGSLLARFGPRGPAATGFGALLVLLAITARQPGGHTDGVRLLFQGTPTVLAIASLAGVVLATLVLVVALGSLPATARHVARGAVIALGVYATASLGMAAWQRPDTFGALFHGGALWSRVPVWLQGTTVGVFGLVPLAILGQALRLAARSAAPRPWRLLLRQSVALLLVLVMAWPQAGLTRSAPAMVATTTSQGVASADLWHPGPDQLGAVARAIQAGVGQLDRTTFDPRAVVAAVGTTPEAAFIWVRDHTHWVPYRGSLRGPVGVLMEKIGNSLDRSLLLAALLQASSREVRLARAQLPAATARELLGRVRPVPPAPRAGPIDPARQASEVQSFSGQHGLDPAGMQRNLVAVQARGQRIRAELAERVASQTEMVLRTLGQRSGAAGGARDDILAAMSDHWWVQHRQQGVWVDLDPLLPDATPGTSQIVPQQTIDLRAPAAEVPLDSRFCQTVEVRVVAEQWAAGRFTERVALAHTFVAAKVSGLALAIQHIPLGWNGPAAATENSAPQLQAALSGVTEWVPVLSVGDQPITQASILATGGVNQAWGRKGGLASPAGAAGGIFGAFGGAESPQAPNGRLTAEWVDYVVRVPGEAPRTIRRELFDLIGPAARVDARRGTAPVAPQAPGLRLLDRVDLLVQSGRYSAEFLTDAFSRRILEDGPVLAAALKASDEARIVDGLARLSPMSPVLLNIAVGRFAETSRLGDVYLARPNLMTHRTGLRLAGTQGTSETLIDLVSTPVAALPSDPDGGFRVRVEQGVRDTAVEALSPPGSGGVSAAAIFSKASRDGVQVVLLRPGDDRAIDALGLSPDPAARMRQALADGHVLVAPARPIAGEAGTRTCFYRVNPTTGDTAGVLDNGFNGRQSNLDYAATVKSTAVARGGITAAGAAGESALHSVWVDFMFWIIQNPVTAAAIAIAGMSLALLAYATSWVFEARRHLEAARSKW